MDKNSQAVGARVDRGVRPAGAEAELTAAVASAWRRHAQRVHYRWPMGCGGHAALQTPEVMAELGFQQAVREVINIIEGKA